MAQHNMLYVYDPLAVHHIVVKDVDMFELPPFEIEINKISFGLGLSNCIGRCPLIDSIRNISDL